MTLKVVELDEAWAGRYEAYCRSCSQYLIYYSWKYREFLRELLGCRAIYLGAVDSAGDLKGVLPMMEKNGPWGTVLNSLPFFGSYGGVLSDHEEARQVLWAAFDEQTRKPGLAASTIVRNPLDREACPIAGDIEDSRISQFSRLDFGGDPEAALLALIDPAARRNIRTAQRAEIAVSIDNGALQELKEIHRENILAIGGRVKPDRFFSLLPRFFVPGEDYRLYVAHLDGELIGALLLLYAGNVVEYFTPGIRLAYRAQQPSALLLYRAMIDAANEGYRLWNWGGTWLTQEGVLRFKRKWGAEDHVYHYHTRVGNPTLLQQSAAQLLEHYDYFYVLPFDRLLLAVGVRS